MKVNNRVRFTIPVEFTKDGKTISEYVKVPFDLFMSTFVTYCNERKDVNLDGTDRSIWNLLGNDFFENFMDREIDFEEELIQAYSNSPYYEDDLEFYESDFEED